MVMQFSDLTQEHYRKLSKKDLARTKAFLESNWSSYSRYAGLSEEEAFETIGEDLRNADLAYAWASRVGTLTERACDLEHF
jgi:hypothetical protein